jgi:hypothetical protein
MIIAKCNLCNGELPVDDVWENRDSQHRKWHSPHSVTGRIYTNHIRGEVHYTFMYD